MTDGVTIDPSTYELDKLAVVRGRSLEGDLERAQSI